MTATTIIIALAWPIAGLAVLIPHLDEHKCLWCLALAAVVCAVLGPLVWVLLAVLVMGRVAFDAFKGREL